MHVDRPFLLQTMYKSVIIFTLLALVALAQANYGVWNGLGGGWGNGGWGNGGWGNGVGWGNGGAWLNGGGWGNGGLGGGLALGGLRGYGY